MTLVGKIHLKWTITFKGLKNELRVASTLLKMPHITNLISRENEESEIEWVRKKEENISPSIRNGLPCSKKSVCVCARQYMGIREKENERERERERDRKKNFILYLSPARNHVSIPAMSRSPLKFSDQLRRQFFNQPFLFLLVFELS